MSEEPGQPSEEVGESETSMGRGFRETVKVRAYEADVCGVDAVEAQVGPQDEVQDEAQDEPRKVICFEIESDIYDKKAKEFVFDKRPKKMLKKDYHLVDLELGDNTKVGLTFAPNPMIAFWVDMGTPSNPNPSCPSRASYCEEVYAVCVDDTKLTVRNDNLTPATFHFSLGFLKKLGDPKSPSSYVRIDPVGRNRDGGI